MRLGVAAAGALAVLVAAPFAGGSTVRGAASPPDAGALAQRLVGSGTRCDEPRRFVARDGERSEFRCRSLALATFASHAAARSWVARRTAESWFAARYVVAGDRWTAWTWDVDVARGVRDALGGRIVRVSLLPPRAIAVYRACDLRPPSTACPLPPPARPTPRAPLGPVYSFPFDYWDSDGTDTVNGLDVIRRTAPGTASITGVVEARLRRPRIGAPLAGVVVTLTSVHVDGAADPPGAPVSLRTVTDEQGGFAFVDVPVGGQGSCYVENVDGDRLASLGQPAFRYEAFLAPDQESQQTVELGGSPDGEWPCAR